MAVPPRLFRADCIPAASRETMREMVKLNEPVGAWRSPVAYSLGERVVGRSNRLAPTKYRVGQGIERDGRCRTDLLDHRLTQDRPKKLPPAAFFF